MTRETYMLWLLIGMAPPLTLFPFWFVLMARRTWFRTLPGIAVMVSTSSLAALVDAALARRLLGDYPHRDVILMVILTGIFLGAWLKFGALVYESLIRPGAFRAALRRAFRHRAR